MINSLINSRTAAFVAGSLLVAGSLQAASFEGTTTGTFENVTGGSGMVLAGEGTSRIEWGTPLTAGGPSALEYIPLEEFAGECDEWFTVGNLSYENRVTGRDTGPDTAQLLIDVTFTLPGAGNEQFTYTFAFDPTVNEGNPANPGNDDTLILPAGQTAEVVIDGRSYQVSLAFAENELTVTEGADGNVALNAYIQCPDGGLTIMLLGAALGTMGVFSRRMKF